MASEVRILSASLEDDGETKQIVVRGIVDQETLKYIRLDWYQREQGFSDSHNNEILAAYFDGAKVADITLGMRGQRVTSKGDTYHLLDRCYCIDGGQRLYNAAVAIRERPDLKIRLGAKVYVGTTEDFENDLFCKLGTTQIRIAPSVLIRNRKKKSPAARILVELTKNSDFVLRERVAWDQRRSIYELMAGYTLARIVAMLHSHKGGPLKNTKAYDILDGLDGVIARIGEEMFTQNVMRFFGAIDRCWTVRNLASRMDPHPQLKPQFLNVIAELMSAHPEFWNDSERSEFYFADKYARRLKGLKLADYLHNTKIVPRDVLMEVLRKRLNVEPIFEVKDEAA